LITSINVAVLPIPGTPEMYKLSDKPYFFSPSVKNYLIKAFSKSRQTIKFALLLENTSIAL